MRDGVDAECVALVLSVRDSMSAPLGVSLDRRRSADST